jgi:hypothetical protein
MTREYLRTMEAAEYTRTRYGIGNAKTFQKWRVTRSDGPPFRKMGRAVVYRVTDLDAWALSQMSEPKRSTSEVAAQKGA